MNLDYDSFIKGVITGLKLGRTPQPWRPAPESAPILTEDLAPITTEDGTELETE